MQSGLGIVLASLSAFSTSVTTALDCSPDISFCSFIAENRESQRNFNGLSELQFYGGVNTTSGLFFSLGLGSKEAIYEKVRQ